jgi:D-alanyl-D-alanine carboxypeptidase/D-alanyl-D-alanine-endopeptidase (penicillin-binding protein 4)
LRLFFLLISYLPTATRYLLLATCCLLFSSCTIQKKISKSAQTILSTAALTSAHTGISIFEPATGKYWFNFQGDKYFIPASNTKIPTCYAAMKYLKDSLTGLRFEETNDSVYIFPTGDPTFLHSDFKQQPVFDFLKNTSKKIILNISQWNEKGWGNGWSWNDYNEIYMAERSIMPVYGNVARFSNQLKSLKVIPEFFSDYISRDSSTDENLYPTSVQRELAANNFFIIGRSDKENIVEAPFYTEDGEIIFKLLSDTIHKQVFRSWIVEKRNCGRSIIHSQPTDSLLKVTMHRSDNFLAEQALLMVSNEKLGIMNDQVVIDEILKTDFKDLPQPPRWVDGSGLSRYNLFTPQDFVTILNMMKNEFGMERMKIILPTGGTGTISSYYKADSNYIFAKTGTLSGVVALSGYLYTNKNKLLIFSVLVNNHQSSATSVRREVEKFIQGIRNRW